MKSFSTSVDRSTILTPGTAELPRLRFHFLLPHLWTERVRDQTERALKDPIINAQPALATVLKVTPKVLQGWP